MHIKLTDTVVHKHPKIPGILRDSILTGFGVGIYTSGKGLIHHLLCKLHLFTQLT